MTIKAYVYKLTHNVTGEYYIGYREANKVSAELDLGIKYFSSSKIVRDNFKDFKSEILQEFMTGGEAYDHEQHLIKTCKRDPLLLNRRYDNGEGLRFIFRGPHSEETKKLISEKCLGNRYKLSEEVKLRMSNAAKNRKPMEDSTKKKIAQSLTGKQHSNETKAKMSLSHVGREYSTKSEETKARMSIGQKATWTPEKREHRSFLSANQSEETRKKISNSLKGKKRTAEQKLKYSEAAKLRHAKRKQLLREQL